MTATFLPRASERAARLIEARHLEPCDVIRYHGLKALVVAVHYADHAVLVVSLRFEHRECAVWLRSREMVELVERSDERGVRLRAEAAQTKAVSMDNDDTRRPHLRVPELPLASLLRPRLHTNDLAREAQVHPSYVSRAARGQVPASRKLRAAAMKLTGLPEEELFGDRLRQEAKDAGE